MDKFKVIDKVTFENMLQSTNSKTATKTVQKIRNSKYKRTTATNNFNLMEFLKPRQREKGSKKIKRRVIDVSIVPIKNKGKKRENGKKKSTRLKKSILQYRQKKREQEQTEKQLNINDIDDTESKKRSVPGIHSSRFREYCNCCKTNDLIKLGEQLIRELNRFQRRAFAQNEIKANAHRRFVVGFRQVEAYLRINKIKLVFIATDCERNEGGDVNVGLDETIESIKKTCNDQKLPVVFAFRRREMAYFLYKKASISCIGVLDYDGAREIFSQLMEALKCAREMYESLHSNN